MATHKHSLKVNGAMTSIAVDDEFWDGLQEIARSRGSTVTGIVNEVNKGRSTPNLSSAVRVFVIEYFMALAKRQGTPQAIPIDAAEDERMTGPER